MANLTLRGVKGSPLTHVELDANFAALDSDLRTGHFDSGIVVDNGIVVDTGDLVVTEGNLVLENGDIHYNPKLGFYDLQSASERMRIDSTGSLLIGSQVNSQNVNLKVARTGDQHVLFGCRSSVVDQTAFLQLGPAATGTEKSGGLRAKQSTANFEDWEISIVSYNGSDYVDAITVNPNGSVDVNTKIDFHDSATFNDGIHVNGDIELSGNLIMPGGGNIERGTVESVAMEVPTGFTVANSPITTVGTFVIDFDAGYHLPTTLKQTQWDTAYGWGDHSIVGYHLTSEFNARNINTGNGLTGGGNLSADRTIQMTGSYTGNFSATGSLSGASVAATGAVTGASMTATGAISGGSVTSNGAINAAGDITAFYNSSDERLKENITIIDNALDKVSTLKGVNFNYIASGIQSTGLIAQDVERVLPEAVFEDDDGHKGIRYQITVGLLVEAIKELKAEIEELKKAK